MAFFPGQSSSHVPEQDVMTSCIMAVEAEAGNEEAGRLGTYHATLLTGRGERLSFEGSWFSERLTFRNKLKRALYRTLSALTRKELLWDALTDMRPAKPALNLSQRGKTAEEIRAELKCGLFLSNARNTLCARAMENELRAIRGFDFTIGYSLYIDIPFCLTTYLYCSFPSYPARKNKAAPYLAALREELRLTAEMMAGRRLDAVYMGGGMLANLMAKRLRPLSLFVCEIFNFSACQEFTVEAGRPDSTTREKLLAPREAGVDRVSISPQTLKQAMLDLIGRLHTVEQFTESFVLVRELGLDNINIDLIMGLPNETEADVRCTIEGICTLSPDDVIIRSLALKRAACLSTKREDYRDIRYGDANQMVELVASYCEEMGLLPYYPYRQKNMTGNLENVGWCCPGKEGLYNILTMEEPETVVGCGVGTTTRVMRGEGQYDRFENVKDPVFCIERLPEPFAKKQRALVGDVLG